MDYTQATLNGLAIPNRSSITVGFQWGATTSYGNTETVSTLGGPSATIDQNYSLTVTGLTFATTHHFRAFASNSGGFFFGPNQSFRTRGLSAETLPASGLTQTAATLNGAVNPGGSNTTAWFEFGFSTNYGNITPPRALGSGDANTNFSETLSGLIPGVVYHYRAAASNSSGTVFGADESFPSIAQRDYIKASDAGQFQEFGGAVAIDDDTMVVGAQGALGGGAAYVFVRNGDSWAQQAKLVASVRGFGDEFGPPLPPIAEIGVLATNITVLDGANAPQIVVVVGFSSFASFTIQNTGTGPMTGLGVTIDGPDAAMFSVATPPLAPLAPTSNTTFTIRFLPPSSGTKTATLHIASNDADENPFDIVLTGLSLSFTQDRDSDGLSDASEFQLAPLGFNFQVRQTNLVNTFLSNASGAGLFTQTQLQALNVNSRCSRATHSPVSSSSLSAWRRPPT